jgi:hypothetical protein
MNYTELANNVYLKDNYKRTIGISIFEGRMVRVIKNPATFAESLPLELAGLCLICGRKGCADAHIVLDGDE